MSILPRINRTVLGRMAIVFALLLLAVILVPFTPPAEDAFLYAQITLFEPARIDVQKIVAGRKFYLFPRELSLEENTINYFLEPKSVLLYVPGIPSIVLEIYAEAGLDELVEKRIGGIRKLKVELNEAEVSLAQINYELAQEKKKLSAGLNKLLSESASLGSSPSGVRQNGIKGSLDDCAVLGKLLLSIRDKFLNRTVQELSHDEIVERYELSRLELSLLLNASAQAGNKSSQLISINTPQELIEKSLKRLETQRKESISVLSRLSREVSELNQLVRSSLREAFGVSQAQDVLAFLGALAQGNIEVSSGTFSAEKFKQFSTLYLELIEKTEEQKRLSSLTLLLANAERRIRSAVMKGVMPRLIVPLPSDFSSPVARSGVNLRIYESAKSWGVEEFKSFMTALARSVEGKGAHLVRVPPPSQGPVSFSRTVNISRGEFSAFLSAVSAIDLSKGNIFSELRNFALENAKAKRISPEGSASLATANFFNFCAQILQDYERLLRSRESKIQ